MTDDLQVPFADRPVAFVHDWLNGMRGGERVLEELLPLWPLARIHTLFYEPHRVSDTINHRAVYPSELQRLPLTRRYYRNLLPLFPWAAERMDLMDAELAISISHCAAKAVPTPAGAPHICYCLTPARYLYDQADAYFGPGPVGRLKRAIAARMLRWDRETADRVDHFIAISEYIRERIQRAYGRDSQVVYPPVDTDFYTPSEDGERGDGFLCVSAAVPYKRLDIVVDAFNRLGKPLTIVGRGPELPALQRRARGNIAFRPWVGRHDLRELYRRARGFVFAAEEDFGITPLEAQGCGCPVVALGRGGTRETVRDGKTGCFFEEQTDDALLEALERFDATAFDLAVIRHHAQDFAPDRFRERFVAALRRALGLDA